MKVACALDYQVAICELPYHPISSESAGGIGGTYGLIPYYFPYVYEHVFEALQNLASLEH